MTDLNNNWHFLTVTRWEALRSLDDPGVDPEWVRVVAEDSDGEVKLTWYARPSDNPPLPGRFVSGAVEW